MTFKIIFILNFILFSSAVFADSIILKNGDLLSGKIIKINEASVEYDPDGEIPFDAVDISKVRKIIFTNGKIIHFAGNTEEDNYEEGVHRHDGFFFRFLYGGGYLYSSLTSANDEYELTGSGYMFSCSLGYSVVDNVILFLDQKFQYANDFNVKSRKQYEADNSVERSAFIMDIGFGLSYYLPKNNVYFSVVLSNPFAAYDGFHKNSDDYYSSIGGDGGIGIFLAVGYEWWVSANWGLGVSLYCYTSKIKSETDFYSEDFHISNTTLGIAFSATYN